MTRMPPCLQPSPSPGPRPRTLAQGQTFAEVVDQRTGQAVAIDGETPELMGEAAFTVGGGDDRIGEIFVLVTSALNPDIVRRRSAQQRTGGRTDLVRPRHRHASPAGGGKAARLAAARHATARVEQEGTCFDGTRLAPDTWGPPDAPVVLLVHGLGLSMESWGPVPELLSGEHRVVAYDLRGHAQSGDAKSGDYSMTAQAKDLEAVLRHVVPDGDTAVLVGNSLGGGIILAHAHHYGTWRVAGVVFAGSGGSGVTFLGFPARGLPHWAESALRSGWLKVLRATALVGRRIKPVEAVSDRLIRRFAFTPRTPQEPVDHVRKSFLSSRPQVLGATTLASVSHDGTRLAPKLCVPTLVLHGSADPEVPDQELQELLSALPDAELVSLPEKGHLLPLTDPEFVVRHVDRWVRHVRSTRQEMSKP
jgi:pimeloyl-ACP methyl ester carboxylesterase